MQPAPSLRFTPRPPLAHRTLENQEVWRLQFWHRLPEPWPQEVRAELGLLGVPADGASLRLQRLSAGWGGQNLGLCQAWLAFPPRDSACPRPKGQPRFSRPNLASWVRQPHASACPGLVPQYWELGACSLLLACLPHPSIPLPPGLVGEGSLALKASPWEGVQLCTPSLPPGMGAACLPLGTPWPCAPHPLWSPSPWASPHQASPGLARGSSAHPTTPHLLSIHASCFPLLRRPSHLLLPVPWSSLGSQSLAL